MKKKKEELQTSKDDVVTNDVYKVTWFDKIPYWIKAVVLKYWMFGVIFFFVHMGMGMILPDYIEVFVLIDGVASGLLTELVVNHLLSLMDTNLRESKKYVLFASKKFYSVFINVVIGLLWALVTNVLCAVFRGAIQSSNGNVVTDWFAEPFSFALVGLAVDFVFVFLKDLVVFIVRKVKHKEVC